MRTAITTIVIILLLAAPAAATEDISTPCADEITGEPGLQMATGECITPAEYDIIFGYENLAATPSYTVEGKSVAEVYGITPDDGPASQRPLGDGVTDEPFTFARTVALYAI
jgi:hypothetical protein